MIHNVFTLNLLTYIMLFLLTVISSYSIFFFAKRRIAFLVNYYQMKPRSQPAYYGIYLGVINFILSSLFIFLIIFYEYLGKKVNYTYSYIGVLTIFFAQFVYISSSLKGNYNAHSRCERIFRWMLYISALLSFIITLAILFTILFEAIKFFNIIPIQDFIFGFNWSPQSYNNEIKNIFGVIPVITGTALITIIAIMVALPLGLFSAIYLSEYVNKNTRNKLKSVLEILAGVPTVVYGYFAVLVIGPFIRILGELFGLDVSTESALAAGLVMGIMIIPFIMSLSDNAISSVPQSLRDAALALGSTKTETITKVILPAASGGIISSILLAISRAVGETMIVTMAAGMQARLTFNPLESVSTFTAQIVALLVGDQEFDSPKTLSAFALALCLFMITLSLNIWALVIVKRQRRKYYD